jgi:hypothetical protein
MPTVQKAHAENKKQASAKPVSFRLRRNVTRYGYRILRHWRRVLNLPWDAIVNRSFRYVEMVIVGTVLATLYSLVDPTTGRLLGILLPIVAGLYLAIPSVKWLAWRGRLDRSGIILLTLMMAMSLAAIMLPTVALVKSTVQYNAPIALDGYRQAQRHGMAYACARAMRKWEECQTEIYERWPLTERELEQQNRRLKRK